MDLQNISGIWSLVGVGLLIVVPAIGIFLWDKSLKRAIGVDKNFRGDSSGSK